MTTSGRAHVIRGDARALPLPDASVDLIVTSPPFFLLRAYTDEGQPYTGQIGSEDTWQDYLAVLLECTREWARVLKPGGSMFVNLGDVYATSAQGPDTSSSTLGGRRPVREAVSRFGMPRKSLMLLPHRYAIRCVDELGLIVRQDQVLSKANGLPESVQDRTRRSHEYWFHLVRRPDYYSAVDEIREPHARAWQPGRCGGHTYRQMTAAGEKDSNLATSSPHPLGKLPGSVWEVPTEPLRVPAGMPQHLAPFPTEPVRRIIQGWSPPGICAACGQGWRPVTSRELHPLRPGDHPGRAALGGDECHGADRRAGTHVSAGTRITGYCCGCTPYTDHPPSGTRELRSTYTVPPGSSPRPEDSNRHQAGGYQRVGPWRDYHLDQWTPPPSRPSVVLDPCGGSGTAALVAAALGRVGLTVDRSHDYSRLAQWRTADPDQIARALQVPAPPRQVDGQIPLGLKEEEEKAP